MILSKPRALAAALLSAVLLAPAAKADAVADFYRGKTMQMIIATSPGGDYDTRGRLLARHMGRLHPRRPEHRGAEHARRRRHRGGQLHGERGAA